MAKTLQRALLLIALITVAIWLFQPERGDSGNGRVRIAFGTFGNPEQIAVYQKIIGMFEAAHPGIDVNLRTPSSGGYMEKLRTELAGRVAPDVTFVDLPSFYSFADKQIFRPLNEFFPGDTEFRREDYFPAILDGFTYKGEIYALPKSCGSDVLFYNKDHFDAAGLPYPDATWTWDTLIEAGKKLTRDLDGDGRTDRYALAMLNYFDLLAQHKAGVFDPAGPTCTLTEPQAMAATQMMRDLTFRYKIMPSMSQMASFGVSFGGTTGGGRGSTSIGVFDLFSQEKASMIITDLVLSLKYQHEKFQWDIAVQPKGLRAASLMNGAGYAMNARTRHPRESWELIKFLAGPEVQKLRAAGGDSTPAMPAIARSPLFMNNPKLPHNRQALIDQLMVATPLPFHPRLSYILTVELTTMNEEIMAENNPVPVETAVRATCHKIDRVLHGED